jgi:F-type H+-transporting ATPase subunit a
VAALPGLCEKFHKLLAAPWKSVFYLALFRPLPRIIRRLPDTGVPTERPHFESRRKIPISKMSNLVFTSRILKASLFARRFFPVLLAIALVLGSVLGAQASSEGGVSPAHPAGAEAHAEHVELTPDAPRFHIGPLLVTNSMIVTWVVALGIILFARFATKQMREVPEGAQNFWEWLVEGLYSFLEGIIGHDLVKKTFWFFATVFIFILFTNWMGLVPGVGTVGWGHPTAQGFTVTEPWFRGSNADLNMTLAMSVIFFACWVFWALKANGPGGFLLHIFGPKGNTAGAMKVVMIVVFFLVGLLEVVSILFRPVSLSFRLYGNVFAGENMLEAMSNIVPALAWLTPIPFYFMELLVGLVQAMVFMLLTAVFTLLICTHDEGHGSSHSH